MRPLQLHAVTLDAKSEIESVTLRFLPYCDFNFASLYVWDTYGETRYALMDEHLVLELRDYKDGSPFYTFMGSGDVVALASELIGRSVADGYGDTLKLVPEEVARVLECDCRFEVSPDPDNHDYVMSVPLLAAGLSGNRKAELKAFHRAFPAPIVEHFSLRSTSEHERLIALWERWALAVRNATPEDLSEHRIAFDRALANADRLGLEAVAVGVEGDALVACEIAEVLGSSRYAISHFQKIDRRIVGVASFLNQSVARWLQGRGVELINFEQDLGVQSLRDAKRSFKPVGHLKKFDVRAAR